ncbi:fibronectin type III domain-containing protein, partial [Myxococcota bacterium]|nr:fibronectin type III domain-containing protein [Myxococcota bacterium]
ESPDADGDGILNIHETNTGIYVSPSDTGSNPLDADSDDDGFNDGAEVSGGSNPNDAQSFPDAVPPAISGVTATPQPGGTSAGIQWTTNEPATSTVRYGTDSQNLSQSAASSALVTNHVLLLSPLQPFTTYYFRVDSADAAGNGATSPAPPNAPASFQTERLTCGRDDLVADFAAGNPGASSAVRNDDDGEVGLVATMAAAFDSGGLPNDWSATAWAAGGGAGVAGGTLTVDGALAATNAFVTPGRALEFEATFGAGTFQNIGLGNDLNAPPFVVFGTANTTTTLFARTWNTANEDTPLPTVALGVPHRFRIEWSAASTLFFVDGNLVATHAGVGASMRPVVSDFNVGGPSVSVDWIRLSPFAGSGSFLSRIFDAGVESRWDPLVWGAQTPAGTQLRVFVRAGNTPVPDAQWTHFRPANGAPPNPAFVNGRYAQYRAVFSSSDPSRSPVLEDLTLSCSPLLPGCGNGAIDPGEDCDDGGTLSGDGCSSVCAFDNPDIDGDGLLNSSETGTGVYVSPSDTGSDPFDPDSDGDGANDGLEVAFGTDPNDPSSLPPPPHVPSSGPGWLVLLGVSMWLAARRFGRLRTR